MMKQKINDKSFLKHDLLFEIGAINILEQDVWDKAFEVFFEEFKNNGIKKSDLIYNFLVNFNFGSELLSPSKSFYSIQNTILKWNKGMRVRLADETDFIEPSQTDKRYDEIDWFILMLSNLKELSMAEGISDIAFNKTISKNIFNSAKEYSNEFLQYFNKKTDNIYKYEFKMYIVGGREKYVNRIWCRANIIRNQELCTVSPLRFDLGKEY